MWQYLADYPFAFLLSTNHFLDFLQIDVAETLFTLSSQQILPHSIEFLLLTRFLDLNHLLPIFVVLTP